MIISDNQKTINQLSNEYRIDHQRIRRFIKKYHIDKVQKGNNNAWLINPELESLILQHFGIETSDNHNDNQNTENDNHSDNQDRRNDNQLINELISQLREKDKQIDDLHRLLENQQKLNLSLQDKLDKIKMLPVAERDPDAAETIETEIIPDDRQDNQQGIEVNTNKKSFISRLFSRQH